MRAVTKLLVIFTFIIVNSCMEYTITNPSKSIPGLPNPPELGVVKKTDTIVQTKKQKVDVLWVIDDSCSMAEEQTALVANFEHFINYFLNSDLDWHIGVTSTTFQFGNAAGTNGILNEKNNIKFIDQDTPNPVDLFNQMAIMGTRGSGTEQGLGATFSAIAEHGNDNYNKDFYREDATLSVIVISDEDDHTVEPIFPEFLDWISNLKTDISNVSFSSIVCLEESHINGIYCSENPILAPSVGSKYISVTNSIGGILWDIRREDWAPMLDELGLTVTSLKTEFFLSEIPLEKTIEVWVTLTDGTIYEMRAGIDFFYSEIRNSITLTSYVPPQFSTVSIEYVLLSSYLGQLDEDTGDTGDTFSP